MVAGMNAQEARRDANTDRMGAGGRQADVVDPGPVAPLAMDAALDAWPSIVQAIAQAAAAPPVAPKRAYTARHIGPRAAVDYGDAHE